MKPIESVEIYGIGSVVFCAPMDVQVYQDAESVFWAESGGLSPGVHTSGHSAAEAIQQFKRSVFHLSAVLLASGRPLPPSWARYLSDGSDEDTGEYHAHAKPESADAVAEAVAEMEGGCPSPLCAQQEPSPRFAYYRDRSRRYQDMFSLGDWSIVYVEQPCEPGDDSLASFVSLYADKIATIELHTDWQGTRECTEEYDRAAFHEMAHVLLSQLRGMAQDRSWCSEEFSRAEHEVINRLWHFYHAARSKGNMVPERICIPWRARGGKETA